MTQITHQLCLFNILLRYLGGVILISILLTSQSMAQSRATNGATPTGLAPGAPAGSYSLGGFDNVNLFNGNLNFSLPLLKIGGRGGAQSGMNLTIDSTHWIINREPGTSGEPEVYDLYNPGNHPPIIGGGDAGYSPPTYGVLPELWEGLRVGYGPGVIQGRVARQGRYGATLTRVTFTTPDGTEYELIDTLTSGKPLTGANRNRGTVFVSHNGEASITFVSSQAIIDMYSSNGLTSGLSGYLMMADGTRYEVSNGLISAMRDRNGNQLTFTYYGTTSSPLNERRVHVITDSLGRTVELLYAGMTPTNAQYDEIGFKGFGGAPRTIKIWRGSLGSALRTGRAGDSSTTKTYGELFPSVYAEGYSDGGQGTMYNPSDMATAVELPDGRKYFLYYNVYGEMTRVILPTGGMIEYDFTPNEGVISDDMGFQIHRRVIERRVYRDAQTLEGKQTYATTYIPIYNSGAVSSWTTEVVVGQHDMMLAPLNTLVSSSKHTFNGSPVPSLFKSPISYPDWKEGREKQAETSDTNGNPLSLVYNTFSQCTDCILDMSWYTAQSAPPNNPHVVETTTTLMDITPNLVTKQTFVYDRYSNATKVEEYGFATSAANCSLLRRTENSYLTSTAYTDTPTHLRSLPTRVSIYDAGNVERARTTYEYDNHSPDAGNYHAALATYGPDTVTGRDGSFTSERRGNQTSESYWLLSPNGTEIRAITNYQQFDINGNVIKSIDPLNNRTTYDLADNFGSSNDNEARNNTPPTNLGSQKTYSAIRQTTNALLQTAYTQYDYWSGVAVNSEDANGLITSAFYDDELNRPTKLVLAAGTPQQNQISVSYDDDNRVITSTSDLNAYGDNLLKSQSLYDGLGRATETRSYEDSTTYITTKQEYDGFGRVQRASSPYRTTDDPTYGWTITTYDALGRVILVKLPDETQTTTIYSGNVVTVRDQANKQRRSLSDALGRLISVDEMSEYPGTSVYSTTSYIYDALDNLTGVTQGVQTRSFVYDSLKRLVSTTNPENGTISYNFNDNNKLLEKTDPRLVPNGSTNIKTTLTYDALDRLTSSHYNDGTPVVNLYYDNQTLPSGSPSLERGASVGKLLAITYGSGNEGSYYGFDAIGKTIQTAQMTAGQKYEMSYGYNLTGIMTQQTYPSGRTVTSAHDSVGRLRSMGGQRSGEGYKQYLAQLSYAPDNSPKSLQLGNGVWEHTALNKRWQTTEIGVGTSSADSSMLRLSYDYGTTNNNGNVRSQIITVPGLSPLTQNYSYDHVNRLITAQENSGASWRQTFTYDQYGNRNFVTGSSNTTESLLGLNPSFDLYTNRIAANQGYYYDAAGNVTADAQGHTYTYDAEGRQVGYDGGYAAYTYDGTGQRVKKVAGAVTTIFVYNTLGQLVAEYDNTNQQPTSTGTTYITADTLGSPRLLTNAQAAVRVRHDYAPFGEELTPQFGGRSSQQQYLVDDLRQKFTGKERDSETGLDYFGARYYHSAMGRFTGADPLMAGGVTIEPQSWNRYVYVTNNPLNYIDPDGKQKQEPLKFRRFDRPPEDRIQRNRKGDVVSRHAMYQGTITTRKGNQVPAQQNASKNPRDSGWNENCHGYTLAGGGVWIPSSSVPTILADEGYRQLPAGTMPEVGDIYIGVSNTGEMLHSGRVTATDPATGRIEITQDLGSATSAANPVVTQTNVDPMHPGHRLVQVGNEKGEWVDLTDTYWTQRPASDLSSHSPGAVPIPEQTRPPSERDRSPEVR